MKDTTSLHQKVQEHINCFAATDPLKEMSEIQDDSGKGDAAVKWLALAALHGINYNAKRITVSCSADGNVNVTAEYRIAELPSPGRDVGEEILKVVREITHIEKDEGKMPLSLGVGDASVALKVKLKRKKDSEKVSLIFPG